MAEDRKNEAMSDDELDQIIQDMAKADEEAIPELPVAAKPEPAAIAAPAPAPVVAAAPTAPLASVADLPKARSNQGLTMELQGVVNLKVCFTSGDRAIEIVCSEDALVCRMADGTEFRIPTGFSVGKKDAA
jgi:hypothetical protein